MKRAKISGEIVKLITTMAVGMPLHAQRNINRNLVIVLLRPCELRYQTKSDASSHCRSQPSVRVHALYSISIFLTL